MSSDSDDEINFFDWLESVEFPTKEIKVNDTKKEKVDAIIEHEKESKRSLIFSFLGDESVGKSTLLDCLRYRKLTSKKETKFRLQMSHLMKEQIGKLLNVKEKPKLEGLLLVELLDNDRRSEWERVIEFSDVVILVVDACCGVTACAYYFLRLIKEKRRPFIVVFNKIDLLEQSMDVTQVAGLESSDIVFLSAVSGDGVPEFLDMLFHMSESLDQKLFTLGKIPKCEVVDVKHVLGHGCLMLVVVVDGALHVGDTVIVKGSELLQVIVSKIKALWTPPRSDDLLVEEGPYADEEEVNAGRAVLVAVTLKEKEYPAGESLYVLGANDDLWGLKIRALEEYSCRYGQILRKYRS